jgi:hypothetical protein
MPPAAGGPPQYGPPQYGAPPGASIAAAQYANRNAVEVEGAGKNKAQLIVGIDFVSVCAPGPALAGLTVYRVLHSPAWPSHLRQTRKPRRI